MCVNQNSPWQNQVSKTYQQLTTELAQAAFNSDFMGGLLLVKRVPLGRQALPTENRLSHNN